MESSKLDISKFSNFSNANSETKYIHEYLENINTQARLVNILDGDTIICIIEVNGGFYKFRARLAGVDTYEMRSKDQLIREKAELARKYVITRLCGVEAITYDKHKLESYLDNNPVIINIKCNSLDKYGRLLIDIFLDGETEEIKNTKNTISNELISKSLGYFYNGGKKL